MLHAEVDEAAYLRSRVLCMCTFAKCHATYVYIHKQYCTMRLCMMYGACMTAIAYAILVLDMILDIAV